MRWIGCNHKDPVSVIHRYETIGNPADFLDVSLDEACFKEALERQKSEILYQDEEGFVVKRSDADLLLWYYRGQDMEEFDKWRGDALK